MKKILEIGKIFKARCPKCNCLIQYEKENIQIKKLGGDEYSVITCPQCDNEILTRGRLDISTDNARLSKEERFLLFNIDNGNKEEVSTRDAAEAFANAYKNLNLLQENIGVEMQISIGFTGVKVKSLKDNSVLSTFIPKSELDKVADPIAPIRNAIDSSIRQITK